MAARSPHQVYARALWIGVDLAISSGLDAEALCVGLPFDPRSMRTMKWIDWDDLAVVAERLEVLAGGPENLRALARVNYFRRIPEVRALAGVVVSPKTLFRFIIEVLDPILYPMIAFGYEDLGPREIRVTARLRPGVRPCAAFFRASIGGLEAIPTVLDLPAAVLDGEESGTEATWNVTLPASRKLAASALSLGALSRVFRSVVLGSGDGSSGPELLFGVGTERDDRLELATQRWGLSRRQTEVLGILVDGKSNKDIGAALGCAEGTVEQHVTQLLERSKTPTRTFLIARFWTEL